VTSPAPGSSALVGPGVTERAGTPTIELDRAVLAYGREVVVDHATFSCRTGTVTALVGPNGSGKSSVLHAIAGLLVPVAGSVRVFGKPPGDHPERVSYTLQATKVDERLPVTVREVVTMARYPMLGLWRRHRPADGEAVGTAMARLEITALADRRLDELSGGQRQRVFVAQGLAQDAPILLLDEPVTGLDVVSRTLILDVIAAEREQGRTVVVTTHHLGEAATYDQMVLLAGRVVAAGPAEHVLRREHLQAAYGERILTIDEGVVLLDDPHHHVEGDDHTDHDHRH
jgi:manganese transport system ATP-binding protein